MQNGPGLESPPLRVPAYLLLPLRYPRSIGTSFHAHPPLAGIAVDPTGQERIDRTRSSLPTVLRPLAREREFHKAVPPSAGYCAALSQWAGPCSGHFVSGAVQFH